MMMNTNVTGLINMTQAVLPIFQARPDGGSGDIINVGSIAGKDNSVSDGDGIDLLTDVCACRPRALRGGLDLLRLKGRGQEFHG